MKTEIKYSVNNASESEIYQHLNLCSSHFVPPLSERIEITEYAKKIIKNAVRFEAWASGVLIGLIAAYVNAATNTAFITNVSLLDEQKANGIASMLMKNCIEHLGLISVKVVKLEVDKKNFSAIVLYKKFKFSEVETNENSIIMIKHLIQD